MSVQVRRRREAASFLATYVGAQGELLVDTTNNRVQVHDGTTPGGWPAAKLADVVGRTPVADASYQALASDRTIAFTSLTAARTVTLSAAASFPAGTQLLVVDESGACSFTVTITIARTGSDTIDGGTSAVVSAPFGFLALTSNGTAKWTIVDFTGATSAQLTNRNALVNGNFAINQRVYASGTALAANAYAHDRWKAGAGGCTYAFSQGLPDTTVSITAGSLIEAVEATSVAASTWWLSWTGTATARAWQGSASGSFSAGTPATINGVQVNALLVSGLTPGSVASVEFSTGTLGLVQLEAALPNAGPTRFERRPIGQELALCQRTLRIIGSGYLSCAGTGLWNSTTQARIGATWRGAAMRATPTCVVTSPGAWTVDAQGTSINLSGLALFGADAESATFLATIPSSGTLGVISQGTMMMGNTNVGTIALSAEL